MLAVGVMIFGIAQFAHHELSLEFVRSEAHRYAARNIADTEDATRQRELSTRVSVTPVGRSSEMGLLVERSTTGSPYNVWFTVLSSRMNARWARVDTAELRIGDGLPQAITLVPFSSRELHGTELFTLNDDHPPKPRAGFVTDQRLELPTDGTILLEVEYTVELMDGTHIHGATDATLDHMYFESMSFSLPH